MMLAAVAFFMVSLVYAMISGSYANEDYGANRASGVYAEGKVLPPGWCLEHGYIGLQDTPDPLVCVLCE